MLLFVSGFAFLSFSGENLMLNSLKRLNSEHSLANGATFRTQRMRRMPLFRIQRAHRTHSKCEGMSVDAPWLNRLHFLIETETYFVVHLLYDGREAVGEWDVRFRWEDPIYASQFRRTHFELTIIHSHLGWSYHVIHQCPSAFVAHLFSSLFLPQQTRTLNASTDFPCSADILFEREMEKGRASAKWHECGLSYSVAIAVLCRSRSHRKLNISFLFVAGDNKPKKWKIKIRIPLSSACMPRRTARLTDWRLFMIKYVVVMARTNRELSDGSFARNGITPAARVLLLLFYRVNSVYFTIRSDLPKRYWMWRQRRRRQCKTKFGKL